ncbi:hypothetical protein [Desulfonatronum thiodismutans]|uniref:hypothetical protein n=1 Tax=Desulfonatronum thiodismutans TaxID=159290 RepID=UPI0004ABD485|nr:hypothetical protein [Desulfonatronum thiodismutans]
MESAQLIENVGRDNGEHEAIVNRLHAALVPLESLCGVMRQESDGHLLDFVVVVEKLVSAASTDMEDIADQIEHEHGVGTLKTEDSSERVKRQFRRWAPANHSTGQEATA